MELRVVCGDSERRVGTPSVSRDITKEGPVFVIEVQRTRMPEWFAMWYFPTEAVAKANLARAIGWEGNGGRVTDARVTEGLAYWAKTGMRSKRTRKAPMTLCPTHFTALPATGICDECD